MDQIIDFLRPIWIKNQSIEKKIGIPTGTIIPKNIFINITLLMLQFFESIANQEKLIKSQKIRPKVNQFQQEEA